MADIVEKCRVCHALLDEEDLFCANCGASSPDNREAKRFGTVILTHHFECQSCGASMSYDARTQQLRCPYCGSTHLESRDNTEVWAPQRVVPFQLTTNEALQALTRWLRQGWWRPSDLVRRANVDHMTPVYVPYWLFSAHTHTYWNADVSPAPAGAQGEWYPVAGEHRGHYDGMLVGGSATLTPAETDAICPFDVSQGQAWSTQDLARVIVEPCTVPRKYARPLARHGFEASEREAIEAEHLRGRFRNLKTNVRIEHLASEPILLPVWVMVYRYHERPYRFLINGQTGKATGEAPLSTWKIVAAAVLVLLIIALVLGLSLAGSSPR